MKTKYLGKGERDLLSVFKRQLERGAGEGQTETQAALCECSNPQIPSGVGEGAGLPSTDSVEQMMR